MKRLLWLALLLPVISFGQTKISALPAAATQTGVEIVPEVQGGATVGATLNQILTFMGSAPLPCTASPAFTGDATTSAGSCAVTVSKVNGAIPTASALVAATNSSSQIVAESQANNTILCNVSGASGTAAACTPAQTIQAINSATANAQTGTSYTPVLADGNGTVTMSNASANTYCVPPNSSVAYPVGTLLTVQEVSTGVTSLAPAGASGCAGSGVTITSAAYGSSTSQTYSMGGVYGFIQIQQTAVNTWNVVAWDTPVGQQLRALAIPSEMQSYLAASTTFTIAATGCTPSAHTGGPFSGKITLAAGPCTSIVVTMNGATGFTDSNGYACKISDQTLQNAGTWFGEWGASADNSTTATIPIPSAVGATDVISFACYPRSL